MKLLKNLFILGLLLFSISSCDKEEDQQDNGNQLTTPTLISPANNANVSASGTVVFFDWSDVANATEYQFELSTTANFSNIIESSADVSSENVFGESNLTNNTTYYWRVRALAPGFDNSDFSQVFSFTFNGGSSANFSLVAPANNSTNVALNQVFSCDAYPNAVTYNFVLNPNNGPTTGTSSATNSTSLSLTAGTLYTWYVVVTDVNNNQYTSPTWSFTTASAPACTICGNYFGTTSGNIQIPLTGTDTTFSNLSASLAIFEIGGSFTHNVAVDISSILAAPSGTLVPDFAGTYNGTTLTITNQNYVYQGIASINCSGTINFPTTNTTSGTFTLSGDAIGTLTFAGTK